MRFQTSINLLQQKENRIGECGCRVLKAALHKCKWEILKGKRGTINEAIVGARNDVYFGAMSQLSLFGEETMAEALPTVSRKSRVKKNELTQKTERKNGKSTILDGWIAEKQYYSIGEVADLFRVNNSLIRFWTKEFRLNVRTTTKGDRLYKPTDIYDLRSIYHLVKERGFTLAGALIKLKEEKKKIENALNLKMSLQKLKVQLVVIREQFNETI